MKHFVFLLGFLFVLPKLGFSQKDTIYEIGVIDYKNILDSLYILDTKQEKFIKSLREGPISLQVADSGNPNSIKETIKGGWSEELIENIYGDTLYKVEYHDNLIENIYLNFYYKSNFLIYSKLRFGAYQKEEFYKNGEIKSIRESKGKIENAYVLESYKNLYERGIQYLKRISK